MKDGRKMSCGCVGGRKEKEKEKKNERTKSK